MTLHKRTLLIICITFLGFISVLYVTSQVIVLGSFAREEEADTEHDVQRVTRALTDNLSTLEGTTRDWATWDDTYAYIQDENQAYFQSNLAGYTAMISNRLSLIAFLDPSGRLVHGKAYDLSKSNPIPFPESLRAHLTPNDLLLQNSQPHQDESWGRDPGSAIVSGILSLPEGPILLVSAPILPSSGASPARGTLIFGRFLDADEIARLSATTLFSIAAYTLHAPDLPPDFKAALPALQPQPQSSGNQGNGSSAVAIRPLSSSSIAGYALLNDIYGTPALIIRILLPRDIFAHGQATLLYLIAVLVAVGLAFGIVMLVSLEKLVLSRLARLKTAVTNITAQGNLSSRVEVAGNDELASLTLHINGMLSALETSQDARRASDNRYGVLLEQAADGIAVYDLSGRLVEANPRACEMLGYSYDEMLTLSLTDVIHPDDLAHTPVRFDDLLQGKTVISERILVRKDGSSFPAEISAKLLKGQDCFQAMVRDITERKESESALRSEKDFSESLINSSVDGIMAFDRDFRYTVWNHSMELITGIPRHDVLGKRAFDMFPFLIQTGQDTYMHAALEGNSVVSTDRPYTIPDTGKEGFYDGRYAPLRNQQGEVIGALAIITESTERHTLQQQLSHQAFHDPLTGLSNRSLFIDRVAHALATRGSQLPARNSHLALLFLDLDDFKLINDTLGHKAGDRLLIEVGERLKTCVRTGDTVARLGGDEFTILLEDLQEPDGAVLIAQRIFEQLQAPFSLGGHEVFVTTSLGIAISPPGCYSPDDLLRDADVAMYDAKSKGKSRYAIFDPAMNAQAWKRLELESEIRRALDNGDFFLHYQPIVNLHTQQIVEVEALVRWRHSTGRLLSPAEFIPVAEQSGLILPLGRWVLKEACRQVLEWQHLAQQATADSPLTLQLTTAKLTTSQLTTSTLSTQNRQYAIRTTQYELRNSPLILSVNLSARQLKDPDFVRNIVADLDEVGFDPSHLKLEITESVVLDDTDVGVATLRELRALGIHLAIDDFGTGYSALNYLKRFPVDTLKIDRTFVNGLGRDLEDTAIVHAVVAFAKTLSLTVTAEGIETPEQLAHLQDLGCDCGQGFYFSPPLPSFEMMEKLRHPFLGPAAPATAVLV